MRIRHKPYAKPELDAWPYCINQPEANQNHWHDAYQNPALPLRLELGCGKGSFIARRALADLHCNHLAMDIKNEMLVLAKRNIERTYSAANQPVSNVLLATQNIEHIDKTLGKQDAIERIYINFCNPWHKTGDAKHRLTHPRQLVKYRDFLAENAEIWFKTDNLPLFSDSLRYFEMTGFAIKWQTIDLHSEEPDWNIRTEHEQMFSAEGIPIKACIAVVQPAVLNKEAILRMKDV